MVRRWSSCGTDRRGSAGLGLQHGATEPNRPSGDLPPGGTSPERGSIRASDRWAAVRGLDASRSCGGLGEGGGMAARGERMPSVRRSGPCRVARPGCRRRICILLVAEVVGSKADQVDDQRTIGNQRSLSYPFAGIPSFLRTRIQADLSGLDSDIAVLGVPSDEGSPYLPGSRLGPRRIREHSLRFDVNGYYDGRADRTFLEHELTNGLIADAGDVNILPTNPEATWENVTTALRSILSAGALPVVIGGDHAISAPVVRAWDRPIHVVHFDAHIDYTPFRHGFMYTNVQPMRHIRKMPHVQTLTQVGIRSLRNRRSDVHDSISDGNRVIAME